MLMLRRLCRPCRSAGICPESWLTARRRTPSLVRLPMEAGMTPERALLPRSRSSRRCRYRLGLNP
ncbi:hypothetical protein EE612_057118 [Oryza sativa]|nr:hypothetical protein EE612_057118 [Oryza sativa]